MGLYTHSLYLLREANQGSLLPPLKQARLIEATLADWSCLVSSTCRQKAGWAS